MRIDELRIDDFGCFLNARLEDVSDELVVIGGPQRAGKTTFMQALRQFRSGVSRGSDLPPPTDEYRIDAEITHEGGHYRYVLDGHAAPSISPIDGGPEIDVDDVFGPVTGRQYQQLFTISLDELQQLPPGVDDSEDLARVLLGGAYGDIADIPEVQAEFAESAYDIGLSKGNPGAKTTDLHTPYEQIREGMDDRREASQQVKEHDTVTDELQEKRAEETRIEERIQGKRRKRDRLSVLNELYEPIQRLDELNAKLDDVDVDAAEAFPTDRTDRLEHLEVKFDEAVDALKEARQAFEQNAELGSSEPYREWLLQNERQLDDLEDDRRLLESEVERLTETEADLDKRRDEIESAIADLHPDWKGSFDHIDKIETSMLETAEVEDLVGTLEDLHDKRSTLEEELASARNRVSDLQSELDEMEDVDETDTEVTFSKKKPALVAVTAIAIGTGTGMLATPLVGGLVGIVILGVGLYVLDFSTTVEPHFDTEPRQHVKGQIATLDSEINDKDDRVAEVSDQIDETEEELEGLAADLGLPEGLPAGAVGDFYERTVDLADRIDSYRRDREGWERDRSDLIEDLKQIDETLEELSVDAWSADAPLDGADELLSKLEAAAADLDLARKVRESTNDRSACIEDIDAVLVDWNEERSVDESDDDETIREYIREFNSRASDAAEVIDQVGERNELRVRITSRLDNPSAEEAFEPLREDDEPWIDVVRTAASEYADAAAIQDEIGEIEDEIGELRDRREELRDECVDLENRRDELASEDDLIAAQAQIDEGRVEFERVGEAYAVNRIAEEMVSRLHESLMGDVVHSLVDDASEIFSVVTQDYEGIELGGDLQDLDFRALRSGEPDHGVGELSRATAQQLFLSVRLARIRQTEAELPVVLDDAATNFDPDHVARVFEIVGELATTNQVFFLTCHPAFVTLTANSGVSAQYWLLEDGVFTKTDDIDALERRLAAD